MFHNSLRSIVVLIVFVCCSQTWALTPQAVEKAGNATALMAEHATGNWHDIGPIFCVNRSGLFVTTRTARYYVYSSHFEVVLWPGQPQQVQVKAKVLRESDSLVLLQVDSKIPTTPLELGDEAEVRPTLEVATVGFDTRSNRINTLNLPSYRIVTTHITALPRPDQRLQRISIEKGLDRHQFGSAVLDDAGRVIGVMDEERNGPDQGPFMIPLSVLKKFLAEPVIALSTTELPYERRHEENQLTVRVEALSEPAPPMDVELVLHAEGDEPVKIVSPVTDGSANFSFVPLHNAAVRPAMLTAQFPKGSVTGAVSSQTTIHVGREVVNLSGVKEIHLLQGLADAEVVQITDNMFRGKLSGLESVPLNMGEMTMNWDLSHATAILLKAADDDGKKLPYTVTVRSHDQILGQSVGSLSLTGGPAN